MSEGLGLISYQGGEGAKPYSDYTSQKIDAEVKKIVDKCFVEVEELIESKRELLKK
jgi:ATP-dependent Zn protease